MERLEAKSSSGVRTGLTDRERVISANAIQRHVDAQERASRLRTQHDTLDEEEEDEDGGECDLDQTTWPIRNTLWTNAHRVLLLTSHVNLYKLQHISCFCPSANGFRV